MPAWATQAIAQLAVAFLQYFMGRNDIKNDAKHAITDELEALYVKGLEWKVGIGGDNTAAAKLQSLHQHLTLPPPPPSNPPSGPGFG